MSNLCLKRLQVTIIFGLFVASFCAQAQEANRCLQFYKTNILSQIDVQTRIGRQTVTKRKTIEIFEGFKVSTTVTLNETGLPIASTKIIKRIQDGNELVVRLIRTRLNPKSMVESKHETFYDQDGHEVWFKEESNYVKMDSTNSSVVPELVQKPQKMTFADKRYLTPGAEWTGADGAVYRAMLQAGKVILVMSGKSFMEPNKVITHLNMETKGLSPDGITKYTIAVYDGSGQVQINTRSHHSLYGRGKIVGLTETSAVGSSALEIYNRGWYITE